MRIQNHVIANNASIFQHDLVYTRIPIFTILFDLLLGNISGNYIFFGVSRPKGHPPSAFQCSAEVNSACGKTLVRRKSAVGQKA